MSKGSICPAQIDQVIDSTTSCNLLSLRDAYSSYHQIKLDQANRLKSSFITPCRAYSYVTMSFDLKNTGATFNLCMHKCILPQICWNCMSTSTTS